MLRNMQDLEKYAIAATDGLIGHVKDFYIDDETWRIRYLVVDTGGWLSRHQVLISPIAIRQPDWDAKILPVSITKEQVEHSPDIDTKKPVSRQHEKLYLGYYGYPYYWSDSSLLGGGIYPSPAMASDSGHPPPGDTQPSAENASADAEAAQHVEESAHLRSCNEITDYHLQANDGDIGHMQGLLVDDETWAVRYLIVNTSNWWLGHQVLIAPQWINAVSWEEATVSVNLPRQTLKDAPPYDASVPLTRREETNLYQHYGIPGYWEDELQREAALAAE